MGGFVGYEVEKSCSIIPVETSLFTQFESFIESEKWVVRA